MLKEGDKFTPELQVIQSLFYEWFDPGVERYAHLDLTHLGLYDCLRADMKCAIQPLTDYKILEE